MHLHAKGDPAGDPLRVASGARGPTSHGPARGIVRCPCLRAGSGHLLLTDVTSPSDIAVQEVDAHPSGWVIGGTAADSVSIGGTTITGSSSDQATVWLFLVDEDGVVIWDLRIDQGGSSGVAILTDMVVDSQGSTYVTGRFLGTIGFGSTQLSASAPIGEGFLAKVDASGTWTWALGFQTSGTSNLRGVGQQQSMSHQMEA